MTLRRPFRIASLAVAASLTACSPKGFLSHPSIPALSPEDELKTFQIPEGYRMELVLSERDDVREPVNVTFDGNGRMYVAEMRTYMRDINGSKEEEHAGRVSRHVCSKGDGKFDRHSVFADHLLLPRMVLPLDDRVLINETNSLDIYSYRDTRGDGVANQKELVFAGGPRGGNLEHQQSGLIWGLDNWCYMTTRGYRLRFGGTQVLKERTAANGGQWGLAQDDYGKMWFSQAGDERGFVSFQIPVLYGAIDLPGEYPPEFLTVWPLAGVADVQGGAARFRPTDKTLNHFTASCGQEIVRGDRLPEDLHGDALICEPVGRLIRRAKVEVKDGITTLRNPYGQAEFIRSTDPYFRPVNLVNAPDGCLYIVDMYRGIIEEGNWLEKGSYLRQVIQQYGFDKITGRGRIWRLTHRDHHPGPQPHMLDETPAQWVAHLEHPNGWWRDTAQKLLVLRGDKSVVPALVEMARTNPSHLARIHALWTLEGLEALDAGLVSQLLQDPDPRIRTAAIRASESLFKQGDNSLLPEVKALARDSDAGVSLQVLLTGNQMAWPDYARFAQSTLTATPSKGVKDIGMLVLNKSQGVGGPEFNPEEMALLQRGEDVYKEVCFACHGFDGKGMPKDSLIPGATIAPPLAGEKEVLSHPDFPAYVLLNGLCGPVGGKSYDAPMVPMNNNDDAWIAAVGSYIRNSFGNHGAMLTAAEVGHLREQTRLRAQPWTIAELDAVLPQLAPDRKRWKLTASENGGSAGLAMDGQAGTHWSSIGRQKPGLWFQIELPEDTTIAGIRLENGNTPKDYPRGYAVEVSADGSEWSEPIAQGHGITRLTEITFPPTIARFIRITQTGADPYSIWSIDQVQLLLPHRRTPSLR